MYVWTAEHVRAHFTICVLAHLINRSLTLRLHKHLGRMSQFKSLNVPLSGHFRGSLSIDQPKKYLAFYNTRYDKEFILYT